MFEDIPDQLSEIDKCDLEKFSGLASSLSGDYLEIGPNVGGSTIRILQKMPEDRTLFCMDFWGKQYITFRNNMKKYNKWQFIAPITGDDRLGTRYFNTDQKFAFIFIDNDHTYPNTALPVFYFWNMLSIGGYMLFHDYKHPDYPGVEEFLSLCSKEPWNKVMQEREGLYSLMKIDNISKAFYEKIKETFKTKYPNDFLYLVEI